MAHGGQRQGAGRPPVVELRKGHQIKFTDAEWARVNELSRQHGYQSASKYIRAAALQNKEEN